MPGVELPCHRSIQRFLIAILVVALAPLLAWPGLQDVPSPLKPANLPINTDKDDSDPHVSSNNLTLYYAGHTGKKTELLFSQRKSLKDSWPAGQPFPFVQHKDADIQGPSATADANYPQRFYYSSNVDPSGAKGNNFDVFVLIKFTAKADFVRFQTLNTICTERDEMHPWISADDRVIYFSRKTEGGWRLFVATRPADGGQFGDPVQVKLPLGCHHATLTPDGKTMYLQGPVESKGKTRRWGLYVSTSSGKDAWTPPEPLTRLNDAEGPTGDLAPALSRDGSLLYFASDRPGGKGGLDIWTIPTAALKAK